MLRTIVYLKNVWVPPPVPPPGYFKIVKEVVTTDLNTGHRHVEKTEDWTPVDSMPEEELAAANKIMAMKPARAYATTVGKPLDETSEEYHNRTAGAPGAMDMSAAVDRQPPALPGPDDPQGEDPHVDPDAEDAQEGEDNTDGKPSKRKRR